MPGYITMMRVMSLVSFINKNSHKGGSSVPIKQTHEISDLKSIISKLVAKIPRVPPRSGAGKMIAHGEHLVHKHLRDTLKMSHPARKYLAALTHPFDIDYHGNKVPIGSTPTQSVTVKAGFEVFSNPNGFGWCIASPNVDGKDAVQYSTSLNLMTSAFINRTSLVASGVAGKLISKPYPPSAFTQTSLSDQGLAYRLVSAALKVTFTGDPETARGSIYVFHTQKGDEIGQVVPSAQYGQNPYVSRYDINSMASSRDVPVLISWMPTNDSQLELRDYAVTDNSFPKGMPSCLNNSFNYYDNSTASIGMNGGCYGFSIEGAIPNSTFTCEIIEHWEFSGNLVGLLATPTHSDHEGIRTAHSIASQATILRSKGKMDHTESVVQAIGDTISAAEPQLIAGSAMLLGPEAAPVVAAGLEFFKHNEGKVVRGVTSVIHSIRHIFGL